jgi:hypothetical protein
MPSSNSHPNMPSSNSHPDMPSSNKHPDMISVPVTTMKFALITMKDKFIRVIFYTFRKWYKRPRMLLLIISSIVGVSMVTTTILARRSTMSLMEISASSSVGRCH